MRNTIPLNGLFADYSAGLIEKRKLEGEILKSIKEDVLHLNNWDREDNDDFLSWLYPRVSQAIGTYRETGASFETYISSMVRMTAKEFRSTKFRNYLTESAAWMSVFPEMYAFEEPPEYALTEEKTMPLTSTPRQLLILLLKCCFYVSGDFIEKAAPRLGVRPEELSNMVFLLKSLREKREKRNALLQEKANYQFCRCMYYEKRLKDLPENCIAAQRIRDRLKRGWDRLVNLRKRIARRLPDPSNRQIAKILGLSKGTVDSVLFRLKSQINRDDEIILN
jgi:RNA polymerase sigma factor (sigma-70 family)